MSRSKAFQKLTLGMTGAVALVLIVSILFIVGSEVHWVTSDSSTGLLVAPSSVPPSIRNIVPPAVCTSRIVLDDDLSSNQKLPKAFGRYLTWTSYVQPSYDSVIRVYDLGADLRYSTADDSLFTVASPGPRSEVVDIVDDTLYFTRFQYLPQTSEFEGTFHSCVLDDPLNPNYCGTTSVLIPLPARFPNNIAIQDRLVGYSEPVPGPNGWESRTSIIDTTTGNIVWDSDVLGMVGKSGNDGLSFGGKFFVINHMWQPPLSHLTPLFNTHDFSLINMNSGIISGMPVYMREYLGPQPSGLQYPILSVFDYASNGAAFFGQFDSNGFAAKKFLLPDGTDYSYDSSSQVSNSGIVTVARTGGMVVNPYHSNMVLYRHTMSQLNHFPFPEWSTTVVEPYGAMDFDYFGVSVSGPTVLYAGTLTSGTRQQVFYRKCV